MLNALTYQDLNRWLSALQKRSLLVSLPQLTVQGKEHFWPELLGIVGRRDETFCPRLVGPSACRTEQHLELGVRQLAANGITHIHRARVDLEPGPSNLGAVWNSQYLPRVQVNNPFVLFVRHRSTGLLLVGALVEYPDPTAVLRPVHRHLCAPSITYDPDRSLQRQISIRPKIEMLNATAVGPAPEGLHHRIFQRYKGPILYCYLNSAVHPAREPRGAVQLDLRATSRGQIVEAHLAHSTLKHPRINRCLLRALRPRRTARIPTPLPARLSFTVRFSAQYADGTYPYR